MPMTLRALVLIVVGVLARCQVRIELSRIEEEPEFAKQSGPDGSVVPLINHYGLHYTATARVGTPGQAMRVKIDANFMDTWVPVAAALSTQSTHYYFDPGRSSTYSRIHGFFSTYFVGSGDWGRDVWSIGTLRIEKFEFGLAKNLSNFAGYERRPFDGIMGLGFDHNGGVPRVLRLLVKSGQIGAPIFAFYIGDTSELSLGGPAEDHYEGSFHFVDLAGRSDWSVAVDGVRFGSRKRWMASPNAQLNPWWSSIRGPRDATTTFLGKWVAMGATEEEGVWWAPCGTDGPALHFKIGGRKYTLEPQDLLRPWDSRCYVGVFPSDDDKWGLGVPFLQKYYVQFDAGEKRIGLALSKHPGDNFV